MVVAARAGAGPGRPGGGGPGGRCGSLTRGGGDAWGAARAVPSRMIFGRSISPVITQRPLQNYGSWAVPDTTPILPDAYLTGPTIAVGNASLAGTWHPAGGGARRRPPGTRPR